MSGFMRAREIWRSPVREIVLLGAVPLVLQSVFSTGEYMELAAWSSTVIHCVFCAQFCVSYLRDWQYRSFHANITIVTWVICRITVGVVLSLGRRHFSVPLQKRVTALVHKICPCTNPNCMWHLTALRNYLKSFMWFKRSVFNFNNLLLDMQTQKVLQSCGLYTDRLFRVWQWTMLWFKNMHGKLSEYHIVFAQEQSCVHI